MMQDQPEASHQDSAKQCKWIKCIVIAEHQNVPSQLFRSQEQPAAAGAPRKGAARKQPRTGRSTQKTLRTHPTRKSPKDALATKTPKRSFLNQKLLQSQYLLTAF